MLRGGLRALGVACALACIPAMASAGPLPGEAPALQIRVESSTSDYDYVAEQRGSLNPDGETYSNVGNGNGVDFNVSWDLDVNPDPFIVGTTADRYEAPVHRLDDCGHWAMAERPDEAARLIAALVATAPGA